MTRAQHCLYGYIVKVDATYAYGAFSGTVVRAAPANLRVPPGEVRTVGQRLIDWRCADFVPYK